MALSGVIDVSPTAGLRNEIPSLLPTNHNRQVKISLANEDIWKQFYYNTTEMIITKTGRRMFPTVRIKVSGLQPASYYFLIMEVSPVDNFRYRYNGNEWMLVTCDDTPLFPCLYKHPDSPALGYHWMEDIISFEKLKLTNKLLYRESHFLDQMTIDKVTLRSMHKYVVKIHVVPGSDICYLQNRNLFQTFLLRYTTFIAVTAYQNVKVTQLKINNNPFARGFRDNTEMNEKMSKEQVISDEETIESEEASSGEMPKEVKMAEPLALSNSVRKDGIEKDLEIQESSPSYHKIQTIKSFEPCSPSNIPSTYCSSLSQHYVPYFPVWCHHPYSHQFLRTNYKQLFSTYYSEPAKSYENALKKDSSRAYTTAEKHKASDLDHEAKISRMEVQY